MASRIARTIVHYSARDPRQATGGVEAFARGLALCFEDVVFMTPETRDEARVRRDELLVVCDNHHVLHWEPDIPVIGFQHGVAAIKALATRSLTDVGLALRQRRAARRPRTLWVACARWIAEAFQRLHGNGASHVVYHPIDLSRFDARLENAASRLVLHDARAPHKGSRLFPRLARAFPRLRFEALACRSEEVPDRLRVARAFVHLSRYEGNSLVCNEAMAMNLPCLFTRVGLFRDRGQDFDARIVTSRDVFGGSRRLLETVGSFLESLDETVYRPRGFCERHASAEPARAAWRRTIADFHASFAWGAPL
jgi:hypothetical protein